MHFQNQMLPLINGDKNSESKVEQNGHGVTDIRGQETI